MAIITAGSQPWSIHPFAGTTAYLEQYQWLPLGRTVAFVVSRVHLSSTVVAALLFHSHRWACLGVSPVIQAFQDSKPWSITELCHHVQGTWMWALFFTVIDMCACLLCFCSLFLLFETQIFKLVLGYERKTFFHLLICSGVITLVFCLLACLSEHLRRF